ncbi:MAG: aspartate aminotransferase family protein, partial [Bacillota bacterium]
HPTMGDVRGKGLMIGIELVRDRATKGCFPVEAKYAGQVADECLNQNMLIESSSGCNKGQSGDTLMLAPAFIITEKEIDKIIDRLDGALKVVERKNGF